MIKLLLAPLVAKKSFDIIARHLVMAKENIKARSQQRDKKLSLDPIAKYKLVPNTDEKYTFFKWEGSFLGYVKVLDKVTPDEAKQAIKNLERETIYYT